MSYIVAYCIIWFAVGLVLGLCVVFCWLEAKPKPKKYKKKNKGCLNCCNYAHEETDTYKFIKEKRSKLETNGEFAEPNLYRHNCKAYTDSYYNCASGKTTYTCHNCEVYNNNGDCNMFNKPIDTKKIPWIKHLEVKIYFWVRKQYERLNR